MSCVRGQESMHFMAAGGLHRAGAGALTLRMAPLLPSYEYYCVVSKQYLGHESWGGDDQRTLTPPAS